MASVRLLNPGTGGSGGYREGEGGTSLTRKVSLLSLLSVWIKVIVTSIRLLNARGKGG